MFKVGDAVHTIDESFSGILLGAHGRPTGSPAGAMLSSGANINLYVYPVQSAETGEVRYYIRDFLVNMEDTQP